MKKRLLILGGFFIFLVIVFAPVKIIENYLPKSQKLKISGLHGGIWTGRADQINYSDWKLQDIDYQLSVFSLLSANIGGSASIGKGDLKGTLDFSAASNSSYEIDSANITLSAKRLNKYLPFRGAQLSGNISTNDLGMRLVKNKATQLEGVLSWRGAKVELNKNIWTLGDFELDWHTNEETGSLVGVFNKANNSLKIDGTVTIEKSGLLEYKGSVAKNIDPGIYTALQFFANGKSKNGRLPIKFKKKIF